MNNRLSLILLAVILSLAGCKVEEPPAGRTLGVLPALTSSTDPLGIDPAWLPKLPDRPANRADEAIAFALFDRYLFAGEPATGLLRLNPHSSPKRTAVRFEVWDELGVSLLWQGQANVQSDETYLVQIAPLVEENYADGGERGVQIRVVANMTLVAERADILPRLPGIFPSPAGSLKGKGEGISNSSPSPAGGGLGRGDLKSATSDVLAGFFAAPLPAGPIGPNSEPLVLLAAPGETVDGLAVLWPAGAAVESVRSAIEPSASGSPGSEDSPLDHAETFQVDFARRSLVPPPAGGTTLAAGQGNVLMLRVRVPPSARPGTTTRQWTFRDPTGVLVSRAVCLTVTDVPLRPARPATRGAATRAAAAASQPAESNRYLATLADYLAGVRNSDNFGTRLLAERIDRLIHGASAWYSRQPTRPLDGLLDGDSQTPLKLRWMALRAIRQLIDVHVVPKPPASQD